MTEAERIERLERAVVGLAAAIERSLGTSYTPSEVREIRADAKAAGDPVKAEQ